MGESFSFVLSSPQTLNSPPQPHPLHHHHLHPQYRQLSRSQVSTQQINSPTVKMFVKSTVAVALFASFVAAQSTTSNSSIDANSIDPTTRSQWCLGQRNTCGTLCSGDLQNNDCDVTTLAFNCTCGANSSEPGLIYYQNTMPTFICEEIYKDCKEANVGVSSAQAQCDAAEKANCGHLDPANFTAAAVSSTSTSASSPTGTATQAASGTDAATSSSTAAATMMPAQFGTGAIALGVAAAFGYML